MASAAALPVEFLDPGAVTQPSLALGAIALGVAFVAAVLYNQAPPITDKTVLAAVPWIIMGGALQALQRTDRYPAWVADTFGPPSVYLIPFVLFGITWTTMLQTTGDGRSLRCHPYYLGAMGLGGVTALVAATMAQAERLNLVGLYWLLIAPIIAATISFVVILLLRMWWPDVIVNTRYAGAVVVFGHTLHGLASIIGVGVTESLQHSSLSLMVMRAAVWLQSAGPVWADRGPLVLWALLLFWIKLTFGVGTVMLVATYVGDKSRGRNVLLGAIALPGLLFSAYELLVITIG